MELETVLTETSLYEWVVTKYMLDTVYEVSVHVWNSEN